MSDLNANFPAESHLRVENKWLDDYAGSKAVQDTRDLDGTSGGRRGRPRGIKCGLDNEGNTSGVAYVRGVLWAENKLQADDHPILIGAMEPMAFRFVYASGTTARNLKIYY